MNIISVVVQLTPSGVINEMVLDGGGHFSPTGIDGVHTLPLLFSSHTAQDRAEGNPHTHNNQHRLNVGTVT